MGKSESESARSLGALEQRELFRSMTQGVQLSPRDGTFDLLLDETINKRLELVGSRFNQQLLKYSFNNGTNLIFLRHKNNQVQARVEKTSENAKNLVDIKILDSVNLSSKAIKLSWKWFINGRNNQNWLSIDFDTGKCSTYFYCGEVLLVQVVF